MRTALELKYEIPALRDLLLMGESPVFFVEGNCHDRHWGMLGKDRVLKESKFGKNMLGRLTTEIRNELLRARKQEESDKSKNLQRLNSNNTPPQRPYLA